MKITAPRSYPFQSNFSSQVKEDHDWRLTKQVSSLGEWWWAPILWLLWWTSNFALLSLGLGEFACIRCTYKAHSRGSRVWCWDIQQSINTNNLCVFATAGLTMDTKNRKWGITKKILPGWKIWDQFWIVLDKLRPARKNQHLEISNLKNVFSFFQ